MKKLILLITIIISFFQAAKADYRVQWDNDSQYQVSILGDSMSWTGGENCDNPKGWTYYYKKELEPDKIFMLARSGATWSNTTNTLKNPYAYSEVLNDDNVIYNQVVRLIDTPSAYPDLIIIYAGANDVWFEKDRPGALEENYDNIAYITPTDKPASHTLLTESVALSVKMLKEQFPYAKILLVTPVEISKVSPDKIHKVGDIIEKTGNLLGVEVLRADKNVDIRSNTERKKHVYTVDGVHTNEKGAKLISDFITDRVKTL